MENWLKYLFLASVALSSAAAFGQEESDPDASTVLDKIVTPDLERRVIEEDILDNEDFEIGVYGGIYSVEDFGANAVTGLRVAYHVTEDLFMELNVGQTTLGLSSYEQSPGSIPLLTEEQREMLYYNVVVGWNILPGEVFITKNWAFNSSFYLVAGAGNSNFADDWRFTTVVGGGLRIFLTDWLAFQMDGRAQMFQHNIFGEDRSTTNLETRMGFSIYF